jgi:hypothetical protein
MLMLRGLSIALGWRFWMRARYPDGLYLGTCIYWALQHLTTAFASSDLSPWSLRNLSLCCHCAGPQTLLCPPQPMSRT